MGTKWTWAKIAGLAFNENGALKTPWGVGKRGGVLESPRPAVAEALPQLAGLADLLGRALQAPCRPTHRATHSWGGLSRPLAALGIGPRIGPRCRAAQGPLGGCGAAVSPGQSSLQPRPKPPISRRSTPRWGVALKQPKGLVQCAPPKECLWADFGGAAHHLSFSADRESFESNRVGDGEIVLGARVH